MHPSTARRAPAYWLAVVCLSRHSVPLLRFPRAPAAESSGGLPTLAALLLPGVKVTLVNEATGVASSAQTNDTGDYSFPMCPWARYRLEFDLAGFKKDVHRGVALDLNQVVTLNVVLQIGATQETVEVTSEAPLVDTASTQLGAVMDQKQVSTLPLNSRDTYQLLQLQPGVQA